MTRLPGTRGRCGNWAWRAGALHDQGSQGGSEGRGAETGGDRAGLILSAGGAKSRALGAWEHPWVTAGTAPSPLVAA